METNSVLNNVEFEKEDSENIVDKKLNRRTIICISILSILILLVGGLFGFSYHKVNKLSSQLKKGNLSVAVKMTGELDAISKFLFSGSIEKQIEECIKSKNYTSYDDNNLIYSKALKDYRQYKKIIDILRFSEDNKCVKYINKVLELSEFEKYNNITKCLEETSNSIFSALNSYEQGLLTSNYYTKNMYYASAVDKMIGAESAINGIKGYLVDDYRSAICMLKEAFFDNSQSSLQNSLNLQSSVNISTAQNRILNVIEKIEEPSSKIEKINAEIKSLEKDGF